MSRYNRAVSERHVVAWVMLAAALHAALSGRASAQVVERITVDVANDYFDFWLPPDRRSDDNYTHGTHVEIAFSTLPRWLRGRTPECRADARRFEQLRRCAKSEITVGQDLYTPTDDTPAPVNGERPYAALLFVDASARWVDSSRMQAATVRIGTTGHAARGDAVQDWFHHRVPGFRTPLGWNHQIASQPIAQATYEFDQRLAHFGMPWGWGVDVLSRSALSGGTLDVHAASEVGVRSGFRPEHPWVRTADGRGGLRFYVIGGLGVLAVGHDLLLEGNTPETRGRVDPEPLMWQWYGGFGLGVWRLELQYCARAVSREYRTGPAQHTWGTITASLQR